MFFTWTDWLKTPTLEIIITLHTEEAEAQRERATWPKLHNEQVAELGLKFRNSSSSMACAFTLSYTTDNNRQD